MSKFSIDNNRTKPRKVKRGGKTTIEAILSFSTKNGIGESVVRLTEEKENNGIYKCWSIMTSLSSMGKSEDSNINKVEKIKNFKAPNWLDIRKKTIVLLNRYLFYYSSFSSKYFEKDNTNLE